MGYPKVLVGCPTYERMGYCLSRFVSRMKSLSYPNYDLVMVDNSAGKEHYKKIQSLGVKVIKDVHLEKPLDTLVHSRNLLIKYVLDNGYDYFLNIDQDVIPPANIIKELLQFDKDIISGIYFNYFECSGKIKYLPVAFAFITKEEFEKMKKSTPFPPSITHENLKRHLTQDEVEQGKLIEVKVPSAGCMLIKRKVLEDGIRFGILDTPSRHTSDDIYFSKKAFEKGFKLYVWTKLKCEHLVKEKYEKDIQGNIIHPLFK